MNTSIFFFFFGLKVMVGNQIIVRFSGEMVGNQILGTLTAPTKAWVLLFFFKLSPRWNWNLGEQGRLPCGGRIYSKS